MPTNGAKKTKKKQKAKAAKKAAKFAVHPAIAIKPREPNGRHQRDDAEETEAQRMQTVLNQPHRRGAPSPRDQRCESALGRFCIRMKLRSELFQAGEEYRAAIRRWRLAKGLPVEGAHTLGTGEDATPELIARLYRAMVDAQRALVDDAGYRGHQAVRALVVEDLDLELTSESDGAAVDGLWALAVHFGLITGRGGSAQQSTSAA